MTARLIRCFDDAPAAAASRHIASTYPRTDLPPVDLDDAPAAAPAALPAVGNSRPPRGRPQRVESQVLFTTLAGGTALTIIHTRIDDWEPRHQLYAADRGVWSLVGIHGLYVESLQELLRWRDYIEHGGTLTQWMTDHPGGWVRPDRSSF
jgi:hypothetical protein